MKRATDHLEPLAKRRQDRQGRKGEEEESEEVGTPWRPHSISLLCMHAVEPISTLCMPLTTSSFQRLQEDADPGQFARAEEEVLKTRKIIRARRPGAGLAASATPPTLATSEKAAATGVLSSSEAAPDAAPKTPNPFAGISIVAPPSVSAPGDGVSPPERLPHAFWI